MAKPIWITKSKELSTINEAEFFSYQLQASDTAEFRLISGTLPAGITLTKTGLIIGVPSISTNDQLEKITTYNFAVRAVGTQPPYVVDRSFSLTVNNINVPVIDFPSSDLGTFIEGDYIDFSLSSFDFTPSASLTYSLVPPDKEKNLVGVVHHYPGNLPPDINDFLIHFPNPSDGDVAVAGLAENEIEFVGSITGNVLTITSIISGVIVEGLFLEGKTIAISPGTSVVSQLSGTTGGIGTYQVNISQTVTSTTFVNEIGLGTLWIYNQLNDNWTSLGSTITNQLPDGVTLSSDGKLKGYVLKSQSSFPITYQFQIEVTDGVNKNRKTFTLSIDRYYELDPILGTRIPLRPLLLTQPEDLPTAKHDNWFSFKFNGYDFYGDQIEYFLSDDGSSELGFDTKEFDLFGFDDPPTDLPLDFVIDPDNGWFYGTLPVVVRFAKYVFRVGVRRVADNTTSLLKTFELTVNEFGSIDVSWVTPSDLGTVYNGSISNLHVEAISTVGGQITYRLLPYDPLDPQPIHLPQGITITDSGLLIGRFSFRYFDFDNGLTTIDDNGTTTFDQVHNFTVEAIDNLLTTFDTSTTTFDNELVTFLDSAQSLASRNYKTFTVTVTPRNKIPYENVYIKALLSPDFRTNFTNLINDVDWLSPDDVYREDDPYFGRVNELKMLFLPGIEVTELENYFSASTFNHYRKNINLKNLNVARAVDSNLNPVYEVIYAEVEDIFTAESLSLEINLYNKLANFYKISGIDQTKVYPNTFKNMRSRLSSALTFEDRGVLPQWMTSVQSNGQVLGLINAIPLAYVKPGTGVVALKRLRSKIETEYDIVSEFNFTIDRYQIDNNLSRYWDFDNNQFVSSIFTRFIDSNVLTNFAGNVDFALSVPFEQINKSNLFEILGYNGINIVSPETFPVTNVAWSAWMNDHAVWFNGRPNTTQGIFSLKGTTQILQRDFYVDSSGIYTLNIMSTDTVSVYIDDNFLTQVSNNSITNNPLDFSVTLNLYKGVHVIKAVVEVANTGNTVWSLNPKGISILIYKDLITAFDTRTFKEPKISFSSRTLRPGFDGASNIKDGQRLIFAEQDTFFNFSGSNNGWNNYTSGFGSSFDQTGVGFSASSVIPGLLEKTVDILDSVPNPRENRRAGIWTVNVSVNNIITLTFDEEVFPGQYVKVNFGETYGLSDMYLTLNPPTGQSELEYTKIVSDNFVLETNFDGGSTRFIDNRDQYLDPGRGDKYVIYPKLGVFE